MINITQLLQNRASNRHYDSNRSLSRSEIEHLINLATTAPSAYNRQNWHFIAVHSHTAKTKLQSLSYDQAQVGDSAVTFIVCGDLNSHLGLADILAPSVETGKLPKSLVEAWAQALDQSHGNSVQLRRDEAIRSASMAAMTLMLAAQGLGMASGPMTGFDCDAVISAFNIEANLVPVMLVTVGYANAQQASERLRRPVAQVLEFV